MGEVGEVGEVGNCHRPTHGTGMESDTPPRAALRRRPKFQGVRVTWIDGIKYYRNGPHLDRRACLSVLVWLEIVLDAIDPEGDDRKVVMLKLDVRSFIPTFPRNC